MSADEDVVILQDSKKFIGKLAIPKDPCGLVIFVGADGFPGFNERRLYLAMHHRKSALATLEVDLMTPEEEKDESVACDVELLSGRLRLVRQWVIDERPDLRHLEMGYIGTGAGAAAAMHAAAHEQGVIKALVIWGGRPDLAMVWANKIIAPTLFVVGSRDKLFLRLNEEVYNQLTCTKDFVIIPGTDHMFEEEEALLKVAELSIEWFQLHLIPSIPDIRQIKTHQQEGRP